MLLFAPMSMRPFACDPRTTSTRQDPASVSLDTLNMEQVYHMLCRSMGLSEEEATCLVGMDGRELSISHRAHLEARGLDPALARKIASRVQQYQKFGVSPADFEASAINAADAPPAEVEEKNRFEGRFFVWLEAANAHFADVSTTEDEPDEAPAVVQTSDRKHISSSFTPGPPGTCWVPESSQDEPDAYLTFKDADIAVSSGDNSKDAVVNYTSPVQWQSRSGSGPPHFVEFKLESFEDWQSFELGISNDQSYSPRTAQVSLHVRSQSGGTGFGGRIDPPEWQGDQIPIPESAGSRIVLASRSNITLSSQTKKRVEAAGKRGELWLRFNILANHRGGSESKVREMKDDLLSYSTSWLRFVSGRSQICM